MSLTQYQRGMALQRRVVKSLEDDGYRVISAAGSKGIADHWAAKPGQLLVVQTKISPGLSPGDWNDLYDLAEYVRAVPIFVHREKRRLCWHRLDDRKVPRSRIKPWSPWTADEVEAAA